MVSSSCEAASLTREQLVSDSSKLQLVKVWRCHCGQLLASEQDAPPPADIKCPNCGCADAWSYFMDCYFVNEVDLPDVMAGLKRAVQAKLN